MIRNSIKLKYNVIGTCKQVNFTGIVLLFSFLNKKMFKILEFKNLYFIFTLSCIFLFLIILSIKSIINTISQKIKEIYGNCQHLPITIEFLILN